MAAETTEERETRLQQISTNQHERLAVVEPLKREKRGYNTCEIDWQLKPLRREKQGYSG